MQGKYLYTLGFDVTEQYAKVGSSWSQLTYPTRLGASVYLAYRMSRIFGLELGYNWTDDKPRSITLQPGSYILGASSSLAQTIVTKIRLKDTYIDLYAHKRVAKCVEAKFGIGVGWVRQTIKFFPNPLQSPPTDPVQIAMNNIDGATTATLRLNAGLQYLFSRRIGARAIVGYQTLHNINVNGTNPGTSPKLFGNAVWGLIGLYWNLYGYPDQDIG